MLSARSVGSFPFFSWVGVIVCESDKPCQIGEDHVKHVKTGSTQLVNPNSAKSETIRNNLIDYMKDTFIYRCYHTCKPSHFYNKFLFSFLCSISSNCISLPLTGGLKPGDMTVMAAAFPRRWTSPPCKQCRRRAPPLLRFCVIKRWPRHSDGLG